MKDGRFSNKRLDEILVLAMRRDLTVNMHPAKLYGSASTTSYSEAAIVLDPMRTQIRLDADRKGRTITVTGTYISASNEVWINEIN